MDFSPKEGYLFPYTSVYGPQMREVLSFRLENQEAAAMRAKAAAAGKSVTAYLEELVTSDLKQRSNSRPVLARVLQLLRQNRVDLEKVGIRHAAIFGSVARGEETPDSDVDILVDLDPHLVDDLFAYSRVQRTLQNLVGRPVDIARKGRPRSPEMAAEIDRDAVHAY
jgi:predicted nucleotidyltransferase